MDFSDALKFYISLLVVCNPFSAIPALLALTKGKGDAHKRQVAFTASYAICIIFLISLWMGKPLLKFFDIRIAAFQLAGGFVLFLLALSLLKAEDSSISHSKEEESEALKKSSIAVVPLAIPIIAGPGAISTAIVFNATYSSIASRFILSIASLLVALTIGLCLFFASRLEKLLGASGMNIMGRIGGLILAAIAVETMSKGLSSLFPGLIGG